MKPVRRDGQSQSATDFNPDKLEGVADQSLAGYRRSEGVVPRTAPGAGVCSGLS